MSRTSAGRLAWLDMEMTGLDPEQCVPLQIGMVVTDAALSEQEAFETAIWQPEHELARMSPTVRKMHTVNGLLEQVKQSAVGLQDAQIMMMKFIVRHFGYDEAVLAGNSIHVDRRFLIKYFPVFEGYLHYRMVDVSSVKELVRGWLGESSVYAKAESKHTAVDDLRESIAELAHYRALLIR
jgi:oligoribonuclease